MNGQPKCQHVRLNTVALQALTHLRKRSDGSGAVIRNLAQPTIANTGCTQAMLSVIVVSATCSAVVAAALTFWLMSRKRTLRVGELEIVDADGRVRGRFVTANGMVGLTLDDSHGRTRAGMFVNPSGQPGVTLFDDKEHGRVSLEVVEVPEELRVSEAQRATFSAEELGRFAIEHMPHRPMLVFLSENGIKGSAVSTDRVVLWGEDGASIADLSSVPTRGNAACGNLTLANQADSGSVRLGVAPFSGRPYVECRQDGKQKYSWPPDSTL